MKESLQLRGKVRPGLRIASGQNPDKTLKLNATISKQKPFFIAADIPNMEAIFDGTVNLSIAPNEFKIIKPDHEITCEWIDGVTETFHLVSAEIEHKGKQYDGYVYYPCPSAVKNHPDTTVELLAPKIPGLSYGDEIAVHVDPEKIRLT